MDEIKVEMCAWDYNHLQNRTAASILRISCPNYPETCKTFKVVAICSICTESCENRIEAKGKLTCKCDLIAPAEDFWTIIGRV